jgi:hypothetical protein
VSRLSTECIRLHCCLSLVSLCLPLLLAFSLPEKTVSLSLPTELWLRSRVSLECTRLLCSLSLLSST